MQAQSADNFGRDPESHNSAAAAAVTVMVVLGQKPEIVKSLNDTRDYRLIKLENGLKALLINDPVTEKAAAALDVRLAILLILRRGIETSIVCCY